MWPLMAHLAGEAVSAATVELAPRRRRMLSFAKPRGLVLGGKEHRRRHVRFGS